MTRSTAPVLILVALVSAFGMLGRADHAITGLARAQAVPLKTLAEETHLANLRQLTFGGENAEAYFSFDGQRLIFQSTRESYECDRQYSMRIDGSDLKMVSTGTGRTTCGFYYPDGKSIVYASTHGGGAACPPRPDFSRGYVWAVYHAYDIYRANADGSNPTPLTRTAGYDAEATIAKDGRIVFTSVRDGDMEILLDVRGCADEGGIRDGFSRPRPGDRRSGRHVLRRYKCGSVRNLTKYCNMQVDAMIEEQSSTVDPVKRKALVHALDLFIQQYVARPIMHQNANTSCRYPHVKGFTWGSNSNHTHNQWKISGWTNDAVSVFSRCRCRRRPDFMPPPSADGSIAYTL